ncbi:MAG TPA: L-seryl-tRNA(Sec) selenium transferase [Bryobacteraceae bacterium]
MASTTEINDFESLPSVDDIIRQLDRFERLPRSLVIAEARHVLAERRHALLNQIPYDASPIPVIVEKRLRRLMTPSLRKVINATGIILHANLGRAPLDNFQPIGGYCNLEYDLKAGTRGRRDMHTSALLERLIGHPGILVNNNAAAVYLVLREFAAGHEAIVSRGELIELGDGFRIPEIMHQSGAIVREVGTTNRTTIEDYREALNEHTRLILRVHPSNFHQTGFASRPSVADLVELGRQASIPVYEDLGSGGLVDLRCVGIDEPLVRNSLDSGVTVVSFSCDKLLGGPQCGIITGDADAVQRVRRSPMYRAFRCDKLSIEALSATLLRLLAEDWQAIPTLRMIHQSVDDIRIRAERLAERLKPLCAAVEQGQSAIGHGATPDIQLPTWLIKIATQDADRSERRLRRALVPVVARIDAGHIVIDLRTVATAEEDDLLAALQSAVIP